MGPGGGLLEVGQGQVPVAERHVGAGAAQIGLGELGVAPQGQRPFLTAGFDVAQRHQCGAL